VTNDPRDIISRSSMTAMQVAVVAITIALNALDGFDVMSISFASPGIANEWGIDRAQLGIVLSMELIGMAIGSMALGGVADRLGRRKTVLGCLVVMTVGMFMATTVKGIVDLSIWRVLTGLGIGGMLAAINAVAAEFSNAKRRHLSVSLMSIGYPVGAVLGGMVTSQLLQGGPDWRPVFYFGALVTAALIPVVYFLVPESVHWLVQKQPAGALEQVNKTLRRMGHPIISSLPSTNTAEMRRNSTESIFGPSLRVATIVMTAAYFFHITTFYFIIKWVPKLVVDMGFEPSSAANVLNWTNVGGATGGALLGLLTQKFSVKILTMVALVFSTVMVILFGRTAPDLTQLSLICAAAGFCMNGAIVGLYAIFAHVFPTHVRAGGTGFVIGVGRGGAVLAPIIAGFLLNAGNPVPNVALTMAIGSLLAAGALAILSVEPDRPAEADLRSAEVKPSLGGELKGAHAKS
jgi:benzoate transport